MYKEIYYTPYTYYLKYFKVYEKCLFADFLCIYIFQNKNLNILLVMFLIRYKEKFYSLRMFYLLGE